MFDILFQANPKCGIWRPIQLKISRCGVWQIASKIWRIWSICSLWIIWSQRKWLSANIGPQLKVGISVHSRKIQNFFYTTIHFHPSLFPPIVHSPKRLEISLADRAQLATWISFHWRKLHKDSFYCRVSVAQRQSIGLEIERSRVGNSLGPTGFSLGKEIYRHC